MQREQDLIARLERVLDNFVQRGEYEENRNAQDKVLERLTDTIDRLNERLERMPSQREWEDLTKRLDRLEARQGQGQRFQVATLLQQNKTLAGMLIGAAVALLGAFLQGHIHIQ